MRIAKATLTDEGITDIVNFANAQVRRYSCDGANLVLFGGEPLVNLNFRGTIELLKRLGEAGIRREVQLITNGLLLVEGKYQRLVDDGLTGIQVTLDGPEELHNRTRSTLGGRGTFWPILDNISQALQLDSGSNVAWVIRINVTSGNVDSLLSLIDLLAERFGTAAARMNLVFGLIDDNGIGFSGVEEADGRYTERLIALYKYSLDQGFRYRPLSSIDSCVFCSKPGGKRGAVIDPNGRLFSCWEAAGRSGLEVGDVRNGFSLELMKERWHRCCENSGNQLHGGEWVDNVDSIDSELLDYQRMLVMRGELGA